MVAEWCVVDHVLLVDMKGWSIICVDRPSLRPDLMDGRPHFWAALEVIERH